MSRYLAHVSDDGQRVQSLEEHLNNTASLAGQFADSFGCKEWGEFVGVLHDVGKASVLFQKKLSGEDRFVDHSTVGAKIAYKMKAVPAAYCIAGHHAGLPDGGNSVDIEVSSSLNGRIKKKVETIGSVVDELAIPELKPPILTSATKGFFSVSFFTRMLYSCLVDADFLDTELFMTQTERENNAVSIQELCKRLSDYILPWLQNSSANDLNKRRTEILKTCIEKACGEKGVYTLSVPTGGGKTVSSLAFALFHASKRNMKRVIYVIPYTSIIEQTADVFRKILGSDQVLENHCNVEYEGTDEDEINKFQLAAENWDMPVIVTTNVQFFESLYAAKSSKCRKLHNIANSVLIFDEAQMLPNDYLQPCVQAINELVLNYGCTSVLCTATQPCLEGMFSKGLSRGELCPQMEEQYKFFQRVQIVKEKELSKSELVERLQNEHQALCILNTRKMAQELFEMLEGDNIYHLSTCMYPQHRREKLSEIRSKLANGERCLVIATSLVEAGVDLDFDTVYRELAGLDSIIQAAGRCNREGKRDLNHSKTYVFEFVESERRSNRLLKLPVSIAKPICEEYESIGSVESIKKYFTNLHYVKGKSLDKKEIIKQLDEVKVMNIPFRSVAEQFKLIDDKATKTLVIANTDGAKELLSQLQYSQGTKKLMRALGKYCIQIFEYEFQELRSSGFVNELECGIAVLNDEGSYLDTIGLKVNVHRGDAIFG